jgi:hypothetical protein
MGEAAMLAGDLLEARRIYLEAIKIALDAQATSLILDSLVGLAELQAQADESEDAFALSQKVLGHIASTFEARLRAGKIASATEPGLTPAQIEAAKAWASEHSLDAIAGNILKEGLEQVGAHPYFSSV